MRRLGFGSIALCGLAVAACDDHSHEDEPHSHGEEVEIRFAAKVGDEDFSCTKTFANVGAGDGATVEPLDFRFYIHDVRLLDADGREWTVALDQDGLWQSANVSLLDFEDKTGTCANGTAPTNTSIKGHVDTGTEHVEFKGIAFRVGVPFALNHGDAATSASPLNLSGLFWSWQGGYKFMRLDMKVEGTATVDGAHGEGSGLNMHLGSTGCALDAATQSVGACSAPNRPSIVLDGFDVEANTIVIDYAAIVADIDLSMDMGGAPGCMSGKDDPECASVFANLGLDLETGATTSGQSAFHVQ